MEFFDAVVRYEIALWGAVDRELSAAGLVSLGQLHALRMLYQRAGEARVQELSEDIGITVGAASKLVDRLERDGLAVRRPNPANRRSSLIELTPAGEDALKAAMTVCRRTVAGAVGDEDLTVATELLQRLQTRLETRGQVAA